MSRKNLCIIVIFCTISCLCIMLNDWCKYQSVKYEQDKEEINSKINIIKDLKVNITEDSKEDLKVDNKKINRKIAAIDNIIEEDNKIGDNKIQDNKIVVNQKANEYNDNPNSKSEESYNNETINSDYDSGNDENYVAAFKVFKGDIINSLSISDKSKIFIISTKLSALDYTKTQQFFQMGDERGIINAIRFLKEILSAKDYNKVREIAGKFVNMKMVEN